MIVWVIYPARDICRPERVLDADGTIEPERWVRAHGTENYPRAIYFFAGPNLEPVDP